VLSVVKETTLLKKVELVKALSTAAQVSMKVMFVGMRMMEAIQQIIEKRIKATQARLTKMGNLMIPRRLMRARPMQVTPTQTMPKKTLRTVLSDVLKIV